MTAPAPIQSPNGTPRVRVEPLIGVVGPAVKPRNPYRLWSPVFGFRWSGYCYFLCRGNHGFGHDYVGDCEHRGG